MNTAPGHLPPPGEIDRMPWAARQKLAITLDREIDKAAQRNRAILTARSPYDTAWLMLADGHVRPDPPEVVAARIAELLDYDSTVPPEVARDESGCFTSVPERPVECIEPACGRPRATGRIRCWACYERYYARQPGVTRARGSKTCPVMIEGMKRCDRRLRSEGLCHTHHYRFKTYGDVLADVPITRRKPFPQGRKPNAPRRVEA